MCSEQQVEKSEGQGELEDPAWQTEMTTGLGNGDPFKICHPWSCLAQGELQERAV